MRLRNLFVHNLDMSRSLRLLQFTTKSCEDYKKLLVPRYQNFSLANREISSENLVLNPFKLTKLLKGENSQRIENVTREQRTQCV